jgi:outer membrane lipoprotein-sorting protein
MKKLVLILLLFSLPFAFIYPQKNNKADEILNKFSNKIKKHKSLKAKFNLTQIGMSGKVENSYTGEILLKGDKFKMTFPGNEICSDGKTIWQYMKELQEVTITNKEKDDESILTNPKRIFIIYKNEFKIHLNQEYKDKDKVYSEIDLFPKKLDKSNFSRIRLKIDKNNLELASVQYFSKDATKMIIDITEFKSDIQINDNEFVFDSSKHKDVEINDLRK